MDDEGNVIMYMQGFLVSSINIAHSQQCFELLWNNFSIEYEKSLHQYKIQDERTKERKRALERESFRESSRATSREREL